ncbi:hypothetical protein [Brevibacillus fulvus]|uniref:Uncharacterized protein n=1 Tax=Brevibacillus fulvus TaxID=1125967 RepID=A0A938XW13_9BACL|nr:hypothetical protein [Brevibacillus fulvus]MBM7591518.1 hypothetical protein [Brevibacillus fulvus]
MNKKSKLLSAVAAVFAIVFASQAWASSAGAPGVPGSADDPVVTKSYVDEKIAEAAGSGGSSLTVVELKKGKTLYGFEGTEFIVRTGLVLAVEGKNGDGLTDLTGGVDLKGGMVVSPNHLLLIARSDSRGLRLMDGSNPSYVIVRGKYELK